MGHSDPAVTVRVYGHLSRGTQEELTCQPDALRAASGPQRGPRRWEGSLSAFWPSFIGHSQTSPIASLRAHS